MSDNTPPQRPPRRKKAWRVVRWFIAMLFLGWIALWGFGTIVAIEGVTFPPGTCTISYHLWATTWPIWLVVPRDWHSAFVAWSLHQCPHKPYQPADWVEPAPTDVH